jgi:hypothetical protein
MKATKAYIASLGTTGVLLAASILMLAVVSAVVAFDRWPGDQVAAPVKTLVLTDKASPIRVSARSTAAAATPGARTASRAAGGVPRALRNTAGSGERLGSVGGSAPAATPTRPAPVTPPAIVKPPVDVPPAPPIFDTISNPGTTAGQVADGTQAVTDAAGVEVGRVNQDVGTAVTGAGTTVADTVRELPLPGHILPGH